MTEKGPKKGLGTGLGALFGDDILEKEETELQSLPISKVEPKADQPRTVFDDESLEELAESLRQHGMIQPITVRKLDSGFYQIIAGERRWRAARQAGFTEVPVRIIEADDRRAMELALVENLQREDLNPIEEARGYQTLMEEYGLTQEEAARSVGKSRPAVANALRLLSLAPQVLAMVEDGRLSPGHARALLAIKNPQEQLAAARKVIEQRLSVRQTESLAGRIIKVAQVREKPEPAGVIVDYLEEVKHDLERNLGRRVRIYESKKKGKIELEYYGSKDRETLLDNLFRMGNTWIETS
ncbi:MAG TPA: ParB/RepB/Spo0J family partition protein [Clostridiales bacterium]|nr:ParB/RepB/Spo0J family partition protein [Clostridiales bacterium]